MWRVANGLDNAALNKSTAHLCFAAHRLRNTALEQHFQQLTEKDIFSFKLSATVIKVTT